MKLAIVVGHSREKQGATGTDGVQEWAWQHVLAEQLRAEFGDRARVFLRSEGPYGRAMGKLTRAVNAWEPDLVLALHFNAFAEPAGVASVRGTMALHWPGSREGRRWAQKISAVVARAQGTRDRGPREQARSWAGAPLYILRDTLAPAVLLETHYGDDADDHRAATEARDSGATARALAAALR